MTNQQNLFQSPEYFEHCFNNGLSQLLNHQQLGVFILVLANSSMSEILFQSLKQPLQLQFQQFHQQFKSAFRQGQPVNIATDDLLVFLKLAMVEFNHFHPVTFRHEENWEVQFNHLRSFRPERMTQNKTPDLKTPFNHQGFHFDKPFLEKEKLWEGVLFNKNMAIYYNKYPFAHFHSLLIPEKKHHHGQYLTREMHHYACQLTDTLGHTFPHIKLGYNALGACASVNHLHFQLALNRLPMAVELASWQHHGGQNHYPISTYVSHNPMDAWHHIESCHEQLQPYNLLYTPGKIYIWKRRAQGSYEQPDWTSGLSWFELAGSFITFNFDHFQTLTTRDITRALSLISLNTSKS